MDPVVSNLLERNFDRIAVAVLTQGADVVKTRSGVDLATTKWDDADLAKLKQLETELEQEPARQTVAQDVIAASDRKDARTREIELANSDQSAWYNKSITSVLALLTVVLVFCMFCKSMMISYDPTTTASVQLATQRLDSLIATYKRDTTAKASDVALRIEPAVRSMETAKQIVEMINAQKTSQKEIILYILGVLSALLTQIYSYYFGSSRGSSRKDETIANFHKK